MEMDYKTRKDMFKVWQDHTKQIELMKRTLADLEKKYNEMESNMNVLKSAANRKELADTGLKK